MIFLRELGGRLSTASRDPRETSFLFQRVSVCMQRAVMPLLSADLSQICVGLPTTRGRPDRTSVREIFILRLIF